MTAKLQRPILVGGIGLSFLLWLANSMAHSAAELGETALVGTMALGAGLWWLQRQFPQTTPALRPKLIDRQSVDQALAQTGTMIEKLTTEVQQSRSPEDFTANIAQFQQQLTELSSQLERQTLSIGVMGGKSVGKTLLMQVLSNHDIPQSNQPLSWVEIPEGQQNGLTDCDIILFLTSGDVTDPQYQTISQLLLQSQRVILVWNKQDQHSQEEQPVILQRLRETMQGLLEPEDVMAIAASPSPVKVRQHQADGSVKEWMEVQQPEILPLTQRLSQILQQEQQSLVWATTYRQAKALQAQVKTGLNQVRRERALPIIEQYQWIAAATAFANPVPALDVLATAAINAQLVIDLGGIYQQKFSIDQAQEVAKTVGSQMLKLGFVELTTQTLTSMLKSNTMTFVAGGVVQGVSAAYLTRIAGLSLVEYFQTLEIDEQESGQFALNLNALNQTLKTVFQQNQQLSLLQSFVKQAMNRLSPQIQQKQASQSSAS
jgi:GTPase SAR1 family protein